MATDAGIGTALATGDKVPGSAACGRPCSIILTKGRRAGKPALRDCTPPGTLNERLTNHALSVHRFLIWTPARRDSEVGHATAACANPRQPFARAQVGRNPAPDSETPAAALEPAMWAAMHWLPAPTGIRGPPKKSDPQHRCG